jgi:hypothetical protein
MNAENVILIENQIFTQIVLEEFKRQKREGITDFLIDKAEIERKVKEKLKQVLTGH